GFFLVANATVMERGGASIRATDLIALGMAALLVTRAGSGRFPWSALAVALSLAFLPLAWVGLTLLGLSGSATLAQGARWLMAVPWALVLLEMLGSEPARTRFIKGLAIGCAFNVFVVLAQHFGFAGPLERLGFSSYGSRLVWVGKQLRLPGLHGGPGASAAVISLVAPATLWLYLKDRASIVWPIVGYAAAGVALHLVATRSPQLMIALTTMLALTVTLQRRRGMILWALLLGVGLPLLVFVGPPGGQVRWTLGGDTAVNVSDRILSNQTALELTLAHPLGMGVDASQRALFLETGLRSTHNAWLQVATVFGIPVALIIGIAMIFLIARLRFGWKSDAFWPALVAFHLAGLFLFEEHLNNPTFVILTVWLVVTAVTTRGRRSDQSMRA
ncbi:hypothetical protein DRQ32_05125, partial [bacterium]